MADDRVKWKYMNSCECENMTVYIAKILGYSPYHIGFYFRSVTPDSKGEIYVRGDLKPKESSIIAQEFQIGVPESALVIDDPQSLECLAVLKRIELQKEPDNEES